LELSKIIFDVIERKKSKKVLYNSLTAGKRGKCFSPRDALAGED